MLSTQEAEGLRLRAYNDTVGVRTVGYGHNLNNADSPELLRSLGLDPASVRAGKQTLTQEQADAIFEHDHAKAAVGAKRVIANHGGRFDTLPSWVQNIVTDMTFNLGEGGLNAFKQSIPALIRGDYNAAADSLSKSKWARQTGRRAAAIIQDLRAGQATMYAMG